MRIGLLAKKIGMSRFYDQSGKNHCATILEVDNCRIVDIKEKANAGYSAIRLSFGSPSNKINKSMKGFLKKKNLQAFECSKEFRTENNNGLKIGDSVGVDNFNEGQFVDISGSSIGKGFAGGMKRHNFSGNRATHGVSISHRSHGSTGQCQDPGKVFKGKKMAGRLGNVKKTIQNLKILKVIKNSNILVVKGAVPGPKGGILKIIDSIKIKSELNFSISKEKETLSQQDEASAEQNKSTNNVSNSSETENNNQKSSDK